MLGMYDLFIIYKNAIRSLKLLLVNIIKLLRPIHLTIHLANEFPNKPWYLVSCFVSRFVRKYIGHTFRIIYINIATELVVLKWVHFFYARITQLLPLKYRNIIYNQWGLSPT